MSINAKLESIKEWLEENVCSELLLKKPCETELIEKTEYVHPVVYLMTAPADSYDRVREPALTIQLFPSEDNLLTNIAEFKLRISISIYAPGIQNGDVIGKEVAYSRNYNEGWKVLFNVIDMLKIKIYKEENIAGLIVKKNQTVSYGTYMDEDKIIDYYPDFHGYIDFILVSSVDEIHKTYDEYL